MEGGAGDVDLTRELTPEPRTTGMVINAKGADDVAVEDVERRVGLGQVACGELQPSPTAQGFGLDGVADVLQAEAGTVADVVADHLVLVATADRHGGDAVLGEPHELVADDGCAGHGHHRLGGVVGVGAHAGGLAACQDQRLRNGCCGHVRVLLVRGRTPGWRPWQASWSPPRASGGVPASADGQPSP
jgi:hypothetical protein